MSIIPPGLSRLLQFYLSGPLPCPYLPGRVERKLFTRLTGEPETDAEINATLTRAGFRRSHDIVYRPACHECNACVPVRIPVHAFKPSRSLKRIAALNRDLTVEVAGTDITEEQYDLFCRYQAARHPDSDMARMSRLDFAHMLQEGEADTHIYQLRDTKGVLVGAVITDHVSDGFSAVYSFFAPREARRSLGAQLILTLIDEAAKKDLQYVYLGYWIAASRKMAYKARFQPLQALGPQGWDWLDLTDENK
ncbi:MAG TPA: arginyltransferase [Alphaproteobacteria bacterium]|nr:arginyltransferase [Alphaproteobacteria bacterium]